MRMRVLPLLVALLLGGATAFVVACGGDRSHLIPAGNASDLTSALDQVAAATRSGDCAAAGQALTRAHGAFVRLPSTVDRRLRSRLNSGLKNLDERVPVDCKKATSTEAPPTVTQAPPQTQTTQTETQTTQTETTTTQTTPPDTTTTDTTTTPTIPGDTSGGVTVP